MQSQIYQEGAGMTDDEAHHMNQNFIISEPRNTLFGRTYRQYTSLPEHNIYREYFTWREYE